MQMQYVPAQKSKTRWRQSTNEGLGCDVEQQRRNPSEGHYLAARNALLLPNKSAISNPFSRCLQQKGCT